MGATSRILACSSPCSLAVSYLTRAFPPMHLPASSRPVLFSHSFCTDLDNYTDNGWGGL